MKLNYEKDLFNDVWLAHDIDKCVSTIYQTEHQLSTMASFQRSAQFYECLICTIQKCSNRFDVIWINVKMIMDDVEAKKCVENSLKMDWFGINGGERNWMMAWFVGFSTMHTIYNWSLHIET